MLKYLINELLSVFAVKVLGAYRHLSLQLLKIEAIKSYLHGVRLVRLSALGLMWLGLIIALICVGVLLVHAGLFILLPGTVRTKAVLGMFLGLAYVGIGGAALRAAMDERKWLDKSGAAKMLQKATGQSKAGE